MRILIAHKFFHPAGGPETVVFQSMKILSSLGHEVIPFSMKHPRNLDTPYSSYFVSEVDYSDHQGDLLGKLKSGIKLIYSVEAERKIEKLIDDTRPHLAHLHNIYHQISPSIIRALKRHAIPVVMTLHDFKLVCPNYTFLRNGAPCEDCQGKHFYRAAIHRCVKGSYLFSLLCAAEMYLHRILKTYSEGVDLFIVLSEFAKKRMIEYGLPPEKVRVLPNAIDPGRPHASQSHRDYILFMGRLSEKNGIHTLVEAMKQLPTVRLKIAGNGELASSLKEYVHREGLENVEFLGFVTGEKLTRVLAGCYLTVFPSLCYHNCPMSVLESLAFGKPVVASDLGSIPEFVSEGVDGLLFKSGQVSDLTDKIRYLLFRPLLVQRMGLEGRRKIEKHFAVEQYASRLIGIYQELLKGGQVESQPSPLSGRHNSQHLAAGRQQQPATATT